MDAETRIAEISLSGADLAGLLGDVVAKGAAFRFKALGGSMSPFIRNGDVVTVAPVARPRTGDVAAFRRPEDGRLVVHRVVAVRSDSLLIKGDNIDSPDGRIPASNVVGRVSRVERNGRTCRLGIGPERLAVAVLSRCGLLRPILQIARALR